MKITLCFISTNHTTTQNCKITFKSFAANATYVYAYIYACTIFTLVKIKLFGRIVYFFFISTFVKRKLEFSNDNKVVVAHCPASAKCETNSK